MKDDYDNEKRKSWPPKGVQNVRNNNKMQDLREKIRLAEAKAAGKPAIPRKKVYAFGNTSGVYIYEK